MMRPSSAVGCAGLLRWRLRRFGRNADCLRGGWGQGQNLLTDVLFGCLQYRYGLRRLVLLAGEVILIGSELLYAAPGKRQVKRHRLKLLLEFCRSYSRGERLRC